MLKKTEGVVLSAIRYKESSIIVRIFSRELGLKSYIINGVRTQGAKSKAALYQPMTLLDLVVYEKEGAGLQRISEAKIDYAYQLIPFDFVRSGILMFMAEVCSKTLYENYQNEWLFDFLKSSLKQLDQKNIDIKHFPLVFLIQEANYLGFGPEIASDYLEESKTLPFSPEELPLVHEYLEKLIEEGFLCDFKAGIQVRRKLLDYLLNFFSEQLDNSSPWKSMAILRQLMA